MIPPNAPINLPGAGVGLAHVPLTATVGQPPDMGGGALGMMPGMPGIPGMNALQQGQMMQQPGPQMLQQGQMMQQPGPQMLQQPGPQMQQPGQQMQQPGLDVNAVITQMQGHVAQPMQPGPGQGAPGQPRPDRRYIPGSAAEAFAMLADRGARQNFANERDRSVWIMVADLFATTADLVAHYDGRGIYTADDVRVALRLLGQRGGQQLDPMYGAMLQMLDSTAAASAPSIQQRARSLSLWTMVADRISSTIDGYDEWMAQTLPDGRVLLENLRTRAVELRTKEQARQRASNLQNMMRMRRAFVTESAEISQELSAFLMSAADAQMAMPAASSAGGPDVPEWAAR